MRHLRRPLLVIWYGLPGHGSAAVRNFVAAQCHLLTLEWLPCYAPELNPVEHIWGYLKEHELPNLWPREIRCEICLRDLIPQSSWTHHREAFTKRPLVLYDLRRTFATATVKAGCCLFVLKSLLGIAGLGMISRYVHPAQTEKLLAVDWFQAYLDDLKRRGEPQEEAEYWEEPDGTRHTVEFAEDNKSEVPTKVPTIARGESIGMSD